MNHEVHSFHGVALFYRQFIHNFNTIIASYWVYKKEQLQLPYDADEAFGLSKGRVTEAPLLILPDFDEVFEVHCEFVTHQGWVLEVYQAKGVGLLLF